MSSMDDNIELIEIASPSSTKSYIKSRLNVNGNKVGSPPAFSPVHGVPKNETNTSFFAKTNTSSKPTLPPPKPPRQQRRKTSRTTDATSESQETSDGFNEKLADDVTESVFSSKSDNRSYREKFKERFESVKKQAGKSASKAHKTHSFRSRTEKIISLKRSLNLMKKENEEIDAEIQKYEQNKAANNIDDNQISTTNAYNFFCEQYEIINEGENHHAVSEDVNNLNKSTDVLITISGKEDSTDEIVQYFPADNLKFNIKVSENELLWQPSSKRLETTEKLKTDEPRLLSEEGFFIEEKPKIPTSHLNILEHRLLSVNDKKWFNCEGELEMLKNPCGQTSYRPHAYSEKNTQLEMEYIAATVDQASEENMIVPCVNILDISIMAIKFKHHPLFSSEHVLEQKLIELYDNYKHKLNTNKLERINKRLEALRNAKRNAEMAYMSSGDYKEADLKKLRNYSDEIKKLRKSHLEEGKQSRLILKSILDTWKIMKRLRYTNNYSNTAIKLNIMKDKCNYEQEKQEWDKKIDETCTEVISELDEEYQEKLTKYKKELEQWKLHVQNENQIEEEIPKKPKKPSKDVDAELIAQEVIENFKVSFKPPGEPILHFALTHDNEITDKVENGKEKLRRSVLATTRIYLRILCNKIEVCKSKTVPLTDKFTCFIDESFSIQVSAIPENICVEIHEQPSTLLKRKLGETKIDIPPRSNTIEQCKILEENFEKDEIVHYKHEGVGSGVELKNIVPEYGKSAEETLFTSGILTCKIGWDRSHLTNNLNEENAECEIIPSILNEDGTININKLTDWATENNPDPQDPKYSVLYEYIKNYGDLTDTPQSSTKSYFRCNPDLAPFEFCDAKDIDENLRFQILELRNKNEPEFVGMIVPNRLRELPLHALADYKQRINEESKTNLLEDDFEYDDDEIDNKRAYGRKYLKQVYTKVFQQCRNTENNLAYEDVVNEKVVPRIECLVRNLISNVLNWFQFQPTVNILTPKPTRKTAKTEDLNTSVKITVNVKSAINVPLRNADKISDTPQSNVATKTNETTVKPFVVVTYQNVSLQTSSMEGANPVWNEELILPLESINTDYLSPNSLSGSIVLRLFDETTIKARNEELKAKNWLGSIEIPVSAISYNNKMEGLFKLRKPTNLLGYDQEFDMNSSSRLNNLVNNDHITYLSLKITLEPNVPKLTQSMDELETTELPYLKQYILNWNEQYNNEYPNRKFSALAIDINGKTTCVTRYIRPLEPPQLNTDRFDASADQCARYVSMIPFTDSNKFYQNVWMSTEQLLKLMIGSAIDHAIALTCYLTALELEVWLLLGYGLPYGTTAYVLVREYGRDSQIPSHFIYDVVSSVKYDVMDTLCPLLKIFCVINQVNVYANVQRTDQIQITRFDFTRRSDWLPLFNQQITAPTNSIQQKLNYIDTPEVQQLTFKIDKKIRKKITKLRKQERTVWNPNIYQIFKNIISRYETSNMYGRRNSELLTDIHNFYMSHFVNGYILNMPYTTISAIVAAIMSTGIHLHEGMNTEFGLAVQIYPYPNHVFSVWICLATLIRR